MINIFTIVLAFCSIVYELLLGHALSAFLGNTVLRYSVTIGLYMLSLGIGSLIAEGRVVRNPVISLLWVEILLSIIGGSSLGILFLVSALELGIVVVSFTAHCLIVIIGILSGFELPLLMRLKFLEKSGSDSMILGLNYLGAFVGTITFAFVLYPIIGLVATAFTTAFLNSLVGLGFVSQADKLDQSSIFSYRVLLGLQTIVLAAVGICLIRAEQLSELFLKSYLGL